MRMDEGEAGEADGEAVEAEEVGRNAQRAPGRTGPDCVMRGPLLVLGWPELSELEGCVGCRALAEHGLRSCQQTRLCGYASATGASTQGRMSLPTGQGRGHVTCWTELV